jgi:hypothetical protein
MNESSLFENWDLQKTACNYRRLVEPFECDYEFKGQFGHPSSYAYVRFRALPADDLSFETNVIWPEDFDPDYTQRIVHAIAEAIIDGLIAIPDSYPFRGCHLELVGFKWDSVGGSEAAVRKATSKALEDLKRKGTWHLVTGRYRSYGKMRQEKG